MSIEPQQRVIGATILQASLRKSSFHQSLLVDRDEGFIALNTTQGTLTISCDADCCSTSWFESFDGEEALAVGARIVAIEQLMMPELDYDKSEHECMRFYGMQITTDKGRCVADMRNSSNGYYGGNFVFEWRDDRGGVAKGLEWGRHAPPSDDAPPPLSD